MPERFQASQGQFLETGSICTTIVSTGQPGYEELSALPDPVTLSDNGMYRADSKVRMLKGSLFRKTERELNCTNFGFRKLCTKSKTVAYSTVSETTGG
jgi:hypothetical protein